MLKIIIAGGRDFNDFNFLENKVSEVLKKLDSNEIEIVSGGAKGVDAMGEKYAQKNGYPIKIFPADWSKYGRGAGPVRNKEMAKYATHLIAFWNGESKGTKSMINLAKKNDLNVTVVSV